MRLALPGIIVDPLTAGALNARFATAVARGKRVAITYHNLTKDEAHIAGFAPCG